MTVTTTGARHRQAPGPPLTARLTRAVGRALALVVVVVVVATALRGPLPGLALRPASDGHGVVLDTVARVPADDHRAPGRSR